jgi:F-type H+-transporting ATPase subunit b
MLFNLDGTFWAQLINFAIFFAVLQVVFIRPVGAAIKKRREYIDSVKSDYDRYHQTVNSLRDEASGKRQAARREADETIGKARAQAQAEAAALLEVSSSKATEISDAARAQVESELAAARSNESALAKSLADDLLARALGGAR